MSLSPSKIYCSSEFLKKMNLLQIFLKGTSQKIYYLPPLIYDVKLPYFLEWQRTKGTLRNKKG